MNKIFLKFLFFHSLLFFYSCESDEWSFDIPGCMIQTATNYDSSATVSNGSCYFGNQITIIDIDASSYEDWVYFSLLNSQEVVLSEAPENSMEWDIAFKRNHIKTNGGVSGIGDVCAIVDESQIWTNESFNTTNEIPDGLECEYDEIISGDIFTFQGCYNPQTHIFMSCEKNPALDKWGTFDQSYHFNVSNYQLFVKNIDGEYVKIWMMSYYDVNNESGHISMSYRLLDE